VTRPTQLVLHGAHAHNLRGVDLALPHDAVTVITGVSGSGKSSLAVDSLLVEARRRYLGAVAGPAVHRLGKLGRAHVERAEGLRAGVLLGQSRPGGGPRSTVGTVSGLLELLRLLMARVGSRLCLACGAPLDRATRCEACGLEAPPLLAGLLSFNRSDGACPGCRGLGVQDRVDPGLLVADASKSLRQGALVPTTPKPYIVYSQVTMEVLDIVCQAHGFTVDTPWEQLSDVQRRVIFYGSDAVVVPFGKHPIESRMRWSGITARPREEGHYKGIITTIQGILTQKRNPGVLRFVRSVPCEACDGARLGPEARAVTLDGLGLHGWCRLPLDRARRRLIDLGLDTRTAVVAAPIRDELCQRLGDLVELGLGHLALARPTDSLSAGEARRVQLASCLAGGLSRMLVVLDEPSAGLHPSELSRLRGVIERLRGLGNTVVLVEHDPALVAAADHLVEVGPGAGSAGGTLCHAGPPSGRSLTAELEPPRSRERRGVGQIVLRGACAHNLKHVDVSIPVGCLVGVAGVSGAGKTSLAVTTLARAAQAALGITAPPAGEHAGITGLGPIRGVELVDAAPIGRTPRSNAATYTKLFDAVRKLFAALPASKERGFPASRFSFNTRGGRCERCEGAGSLKLGMHFLPDVHLPCPECGGRRFDHETLAVRFRDHSVHDVLEASVDEALVLFRDQARIAPMLDALRLVGLGYLPLGQPATTLSGGEARRVKLAAHLGRPPRGPTLFVLDEPSIGLHPADVSVLVSALQGLVDAGHTVLVVDHDRWLLDACDHVMVLGPGGGEAGGRLVAAGAPADVLHDPDASPTPELGPGKGAPPDSIELRGVRTHNLRGIDLDIPHDALTVITGVSGSGKSSLAFDTLHAEAWRRFGESLPGEARRRLARLQRPRLDEVRGLAPTVAVGQRGLGASPRSVVGTAAGLLPVLRLLWSRFGTAWCPDCELPVNGRCVGCGATAPALSAGHFSFNRELGACPACDGLGVRLVCDPERLVSDQDRSLWDGAMDGSKLGRHLGEPDGQHLATLAAAGESLGLALRGPWRALSPEARALALEGSGDRAYSVRWRYKRGKREGEHRFEGPWIGLLALVQEAWDRDHDTRRGHALAPLMHEQACPLCQGERLAPWPRAVRFGGLRLGRLCALPLDALAERLEAWARGDGLEHGQVGATEDLRQRLSAGVGTLRRLGLGYLSLDRRSDSLSGGEARRLQLGGLLGSELAGLCCVLDEPSMGLHPRDVQALIAELRRLVALGQTAVVVEHELAIVQAADHVVELGPGAGAGGGAVVAAGPPQALGAASLTGAWLRGERRLPRRAAGALDGVPIALSGVVRHNLVDLDVSLPTGGLIGLAGVSGSGKSTLLREVLEPSLRQGAPVACAALAGHEPFARVVLADAGPMGSSPVSTPATLAGLLPLIGSWFARSPEAKAAGLSRAAFSYTSPRGRCPACKGLGREAVGLELLADAWLPCERCHGSRYRGEVAAVRVDGLGIVDALGLSIAEAAARFAGEARLVSRLTALERLGLGYLRLDQPTPTLSGGERRRLRLALAILDSGEGMTLFLLDEPSAGLHPEDRGRLLALLDELVTAGHTVVMVEHDPRMLVRCDHIVELGPHGGPGGGRIVAQGAPEAIARAGTATGAQLAPLLLEVS